MIRRVRRQFICITMAMLTTVLLIPLIALNVITSCKAPCFRNVHRCAADAGRCSAGRKTAAGNYRRCSGCRLGYFHGNYSYYHRQHHLYCGNYHRPDGTCSCGNQGGRKQCSGSGGSADTATHAPADSCSQGNDGSPKGNYRTADQGSCYDYQGGCFTCNKARSNTAASA